MGFYIFFCIAGALAIFSIVYFTRMKLKANKNIPEICMGAIRVTDRQGRDMLIIRNDDGSFEMHEEKIIRNRCVPR